MSRLIHRKVAGESRRNRSGLILLVVLGMLALFSMLAVTYVVFASQSRSTSMALARRETRGHKSHRAIMDSAMMALVRGTGPQSSMFGHSLLGDLYGASESQGTTLSVRTFTINDDLSITPSMPNTSRDRPLLLNGHFLRIPLHDPAVRSGSYLSPNFLPADSDALNGRIVTFPEGNGPLSGQSFRIIRYIGQTVTAAASTDAERHLLAQSYSITIDLNEANLQQSFSAGGVHGSIADWVSRFPPGTGVWASGAYACYGSVGNVHSNPFSLLLNGQPLNAHGVGILADGSSQLHFQPVAGGRPVDPAPSGGQPPRYNSISEMATSLLPNYREMGGAGAAGSTGWLTTASAADQNPNAQYPIFEQYPRIVPSPIGLLGDSDEPYDAPDYQNMWMAHRRAGAATSRQIIPSFHRPSLINYIVNWKKNPVTGQPMSPATWTEEEFLATIRRIEMATLRPLSYIITTPSRGTVTRNALFTGGNSGNAGGTTGSDFTSPTLNVEITSNWVNNWGPLWGTAASPGVFRQWVNQLVIGPWDVDTDLDGVADSNWIDPGLPLETTADGKLVKPMVAYYVDDLDSKLDINAVGSLAQIKSRVVGPYVNHAGEQFAEAIDGTFYNWDHLNNTSSYLRQGLGYGPADISLRHLFNDPSTTDDIDELRFASFMRERYGAGEFSTEFVPGYIGNDAFSEIANMRERRISFSHGRSPGLPMATTGRDSIGLDFFGNPRVWNSRLTGSNQSAVNESTNDPYEATWMRGGNQDSPYTIAEWERIYRVRDADRTMMPDRLQQALGLNAASLASSNLRHEISPYTRHLRGPQLTSRTTRRLDIPEDNSTPLLPSFFDTAGTSPTSLGQGPTSMLQLVNTVRHLRREAAFTQSQLLELFPLEFSRGMLMDLNRPFGNGYDDDKDGQIDEPDELNQLTNSEGAIYATLPGANVTPGSILENYFEGYFSRPDTNITRNQRLELINADPHLDYTSATLNVFQGMESRQMYARQLYCLAQLLVPEDYVFPNINKAYFQNLLLERANGVADAANKYTQLRGRTLAQWAVNTVDFRDGDAAMTRFVYDPDPFRDASGNDFAAWEVVPATTTVVWGMEAPEALLTESLAFHDVRVRRDPYAAGPDPVFHQFRVPQGSLFLEIFCPRTTALETATTPPIPGESDRNAQGVPNGLYSTDNDNNSGNGFQGDVRLELSRLTLSKYGSQFPVWRVYLSGPADPDAAQALKTPNERLMAPGTPVFDEPQRHDLNLQFQSGNTLFDMSGSPIPDSVTAAAASGLQFDYLPTGDTERLDEPDPSDSRIVLFTPRSAFTATRANTPGVANPAAQVFQHQAGNVRIRGGEFLVVGPRQGTYFGSREDSKTGATMGDFRNSPNGHSIIFDNSGTDRIAGGAGPWVSLHDPSFTAITQRAEHQKCNWLIVNQELDALWTAEAGEPNPPMLFNGLNISEPLADLDSFNNGALDSYYAEPTDIVNEDDDTGGGPTGEPGFDSIPQDGYHDWSMSASPASVTAPFDAGQSGTPLEFWNPVNNPWTQAGGAPRVDLDSDGTGDVVSPGTQFDFSTAYLQRLADPEKPFHATFNPYITVDWLPIDLTVFNGEDNEAPHFDPSDPGYPEHYFASRQKMGQGLDSSTHEYPAQDSNAGENSTGGTTFYSALTDQLADESAPDATLDAFWNFVMPVRPTLVTPPNPRDLATFNGTNSFPTLGYLNSSYLVSGEAGTRDVANVRFRGAPANPDAPREIWRPYSVYWPNRQFVNNLELMMVPLSSPGQFMQEFSSTLNTNGGSHYAADFRNNVGTYSFPDDRRTPVSPVSELPPVNTGGTPLGNSGTVGTRAASAINDNGLVVGGTLVPSEPARYTAYAHLMNFFQEVPSIKQPDRHPMYTFTPSPPSIAPVAPMPEGANPKNTSLLNLLEMVDTKSPWTDSERIEPPANLAIQAWTGVTVADQVAASSNIIFSPFRAPYNRFPTFTETGKLNLNSIAEIGVIQGIGQAVIPPSDIDYPPYDWSTGGAMSPGDIDHNHNGVYDTPNGARREAKSIAGSGDAVDTVWQFLQASRQGYAGIPQTPMQRFTPAFAPNPALNPNFPTQFANPFRPASEAGMVPKTWNPFHAETPLQAATANWVEHYHLAHNAAKKGVLDIYARRNPAHVTLLRGAVLPPLAFDMDSNGMLDSAGVTRFNTGQLFVDASSTLPHPFTDTYPMTRLKNLTSNTSNAFAVYMTVGFFEYDPATDSIGVEYGANAGESERYRGFFVVDRTIPVGFQVGEDHNAANTILVKRYLKARD